jgi:hypothetical protein
LNRSDLSGFPVPGRKLVDDGSIKIETAYHTGEEAVPTGKGNCAGSFPRQITGHKATFYVAAFETWRLRKCANPVPARSLAVAKLALLSSYNALNALLRFARRVSGRILMTLTARMKVRLPDADAAVLTGHGPVIKNKRECDARAVLVQNRRPGAAQRGLPLPRLVEGDNLNARKVVIRRMLE